MASKFSLGVKAVKGLKKSRGRVALIRGETEHIHSFDDLRFCVEVHAKLFPTPTFFNNINTIAQSAQR